MHHQWECIRKDSFSFLVISLNKLRYCVCVFAVMQCSARMDVLFLMDGSYSVGKGSFERCKHYTIKLTQALDIAADKVE